MKKRVISCLKAMGLALLTISTLNVSATPTNQELIKLMDQPFVYFKTGGKYPTMQYCYPGTPELKTVFCGTLDEDGEVDLVKSAHDLETLTVLRMQDFFGDSSTKIDKKYASREALVGQVLEELFKVMHIMPRENYKGIVLVDELLQGLPMKWVLKDTKELHAVLSYIRYKLSQTDAKFIRKPLLALEFKSEIELSDTDKAEIAEYFELAKLDNEDIKDFYAACDAKIAFFLDYPPTKYVGESFGESVLREIEGSHNDFKMKDIAIKATWWAITLTIAAIFVDSIQPYIKGKITSVTPAIQTTLGTK